MMNKTVYFLIGLFMTFLFQSCGKDSSENKGPDALFSYTVKGLEIEFKNESKNADSYEWDFGDGTTSNEENPSHTYPEKGKYVPTLTAHNSFGEMEASTVIRLSKESAIKLDDETLSDWDEITENIVLGEGDAGVFNVVKYDFDGGFIYIYIDQDAQDPATDEGDGFPYDFYIDVDNDESTGFLSDDMPDGGYDVLLEGNIFDWFTIIPFEGEDQESFDDGFINDDDFEGYELGAIEEENGNLKFEMAIDRSKIPGLASSKGIKIHIQAMTAGWDEAGNSPEPGAPSFFLDLSD